MLAAPQPRFNFSLGCKEKRREWITQKMKHDLDMMDKLMVPIPDVCRYTSKFGSGIVHKKHVSKPKKLKTKQRQEFLNQT